MLSYSFVCKTGIVWHMCSEQAYDKHSFFVSSKSHNNASKMCVFSKNSGPPDLMRPIHRAMKPEAVGGDRLPHPGRLGPCVPSAPLPEAPSHMCGRKGLGRTFPQDVP